MVGVTYSKGRWPISDASLGCEYGDLPQQGSVRWTA
jgi:hypothetical protein